MKKTEKQNTGKFIASCDKAMPAMLMSIGRLKEMSAIVVTGGVMEATVVKPECLPARAVLTIVPVS